MKPTVLSIGPWRNNAELIRDGVVPLGYLLPHWTVVDPTYGEGGFWRLWRPAMLLASDLDPDLSPSGRSVDMSDLPYKSGSVDAVVVDGPYKLNGTSQGNGPSASDKRYGVHIPATRDERHEAIFGGIMEAERVLVSGGKLFVKGQNQINSGEYVQQLRLFTAVAESVGFTLLDELLLVGNRDQPKRSVCTVCDERIMRRNDGTWERIIRGDRTCGGAAHVPDEEDNGQVHSHRNYSTLLVFEKGH